MNHNVTHREWEVAELISFGLTEKEMSNHMDISFHTVKAHKKNLCNKTGCRNIADVTRWYIQETSGIRLEPKEPIKRFVSILMLTLVLLAEFSSSEFIRYRTRLKTVAGRSIKARVRVQRSRETYQFQVA